MTEQQARAQLRDLKNRFAYMFDRPSMGFDFYCGWLDDFIAACEAIDDLLGDDKRGFCFSQIKEKYGWARYYFKTDHVRPMRLSITSPRGVHETVKGLSDEHEIEKNIAKILLAAEEKSMHKCMNCGAPAEIRKLNNMLICVCDEHAHEERGEAVRCALISEEH